MRLKVDGAAVVSPGKRRVQYFSGGGLKRAFARGVRGGMARTAGPVRMTPRSAPRPGYRV